MANIQFAKPYYSVDSSANTVATEEAWNVYFEPLPQGGFSIRRRPGLTRLTTSVTGADTGNGMYWSDRMARLYVVTKGVVYYYTSPTNPPFVVGSIGDNSFTAVFAEGQLLDLKQILYVANGGNLHYIDGTTGNVVTPTFDAPTPLVTFVTMMNNRFWCNNTTPDYNQRFYITDFNPDPLVLANDPTFWQSATNPWAAAQKPDALTGMYSGWNEVFLWGTMACEPWQEDGVNPISPLVGSLMEVGLAAPYSVQKANNALYALVTLGDKRAVVTVSSRAPNVISEPISRKLQSYAVVSDAVGMMIFTGGVNMYVLTFPTEGVTWAYDIKTECWSQWSYWDLATATNMMFCCKYSAYAKNWNQTILQHADGSLFDMSRSVYSDDGVPIHSSITTGWMDHGTWDRKRCDQLIIKLKGYLSSPAKVLMYTRSDGQPEWSQPTVIDVQAGVGSVSGQNEHFCKLNRMGMFRSRQYKFVMTDAADLALTGMEIDVVRMRN